MLGLVAICAATVAVYRIADLDGRNGLVWGSLALAIGLVTGLFIGGLFSGALAVIACFIGMMLFGKKHY